MSPEMTIIPQDDTTGCPHEDAVMWNPYNKVVQCHRCGIQFVPTLPQSADIIAYWEHLTDEQRASVDRARAFVRNALDSAIVTFKAENPDLTLSASVVIDAVPRRYDLPWSEQKPVAETES